MIARNIAHQAVLAGFSVVCTTAAELIEDLRACSPETLRRRLARYARPHLLVCDEVGYLSYESHAADLLYRVIVRRYEQPEEKDSPSRSMLFRIRVITDGVYPSLHVDYKATRIKQYHKEGRALGTETTIDNTRDFRIGKRLQTFPHSGRSASEPTDVCSTSNESATTAQSVELAATPFSVRV